jgi:hypothetical protein
MGIQVKGHPAEGRKAFGVGNGHVVGGSDGQAGNVGPSAASHVRLALLNGSVQDVHPALFLQGLEQEKGIASTGEKTVGLCASGLRRFPGVNPSEGQAPFGKNGLGTGGVIVPSNAAGPCEGYKGHRFAPSEMFQNSVLEVRQVGSAVHR